GHAVGGDLGILGAVTGRQGGCLGGGDRVVDRLDRGLDDRSDRRLALGAVLAGDQGGVGGGVLRHVEDRSQQRKDDAQGVLVGRRAIARDPLRRGGRDGRVLGRLAGVLDARRGLGVPIGRARGCRRVLGRGDDPLGIAHRRGRGGRVGAL